MIYTYECENCHRVFDVDVEIAKREQALHEPCPSCFKVGHVIRVFSSSVNFVTSSKSILTQAKEKGGSDWGGLMKRMKKGSARGNTIET